MRHKEAKEFVSELNTKRFWCGGMNEWYIVSPAHQKRIPPSRRNWDVTIIKDHAQEKHWIFTIIRWRVHICRKFYKIHVTRIDQEHDTESTSGATS